MIYPDYEESDVKDELHKEALWGFKYAIECLKTKKANAELDTEREYAKLPTMGKLVGEVESAVYDEAIEWLENDYYGLLVSFADEEAVNEYEGE